MLLSIDANRKQRKIALSEPMRNWDVVAIVGVGLIGGSIGLALRQRGLAREIVGIGRRTSSLQAARRAGAVTRTTTNLAQGVSHAELTIVCTPVDQVAQHVMDVAAACPSAGVITDAGSIKQPIVRRVAEGLGPRSRFVGSHPLAGGEQRGPLAAIAELFENRTVVTTPTRQTPADVIESVEHFWSALGAKVVRLAADRHDVIVAATSHVPHLVAAALADATKKSHLPFCSTGWEDTTRVAAGDPELWMQILRGNSAAVLEALGAVESSLASLREAIRRDDARALKKVLARAKQRRDALGN